MADLGGVQSIERAFALLRIIAEAGGSSTLSDLATKSGLPQPTIHRVMKTLINLGFARQDANRHYLLGTGLIQLGEKASYPLGSWAKPHLAKLVELTSETANMAVLDIDQVTYVAQSPSKQQMRMFTEVGRRVPAHRTAVGKAMLAEMNADRVAEVIRRVGLPAATEFTISSEKELAKELAKIKKQGYAIDDQEQELGVLCVAVTIPNAPIPTAISISGPLSRMTQKVIDKSIPQLLKIAEEISTEFARS